MILIYLLFSPNKILDNNKMDAGPGFVDRIIGLMKKDEQYDDITEPINQSPKSSIPKQKIINKDIDNIDEIITDDNNLIPEREDVISFILEEMNTLKVKSPKIHVNKVYTEEDIPDEYISSFEKVLKLVEISRPDKKSVILAKHINAVKSLYDILNSIPENNRFFKQVELDLVRFLITILSKQDLLNVDSDLFSQRDLNILKAFIKKLKKTECYKPREEFMSPFNFNKLKSIFNLYSYPEYEVEASLGLYKPRTYTDKQGFRPGLRSAFQFNNLKQCLDSESTIYGGTKKCKSTSSIVTILNGIDFPYRKLKTYIDNNNDYFITYEKKNVLYNQTIDNKPYGFRIRVSREEMDVSSEIADEFELRYQNVLKTINDYDDDNKVSVIIRNRKRYTYIEGDKNKLGYGCKIDLTIVSENFISSKKETKNNTFEVEIERTSNKISTNDFLNIVSNIISRSQALICDKLSCRSISLDYKSIISNTKYFNYLFKKDLQSKKRELPKTTLYPNYINKPKNLKMKTLLDPRLNDMVVSLKIDGVRASLFLHHCGTFIVMAPNTIYKIGKGNKLYHNTLFDCELLVTYDDELNRVDRVKIFAFDLCFIQGTDIRKESFEFRYSRLSELNLDFINGLMFCEYYQFIKKGFWKEESFYHSVNLVLNDDTLPQDGLIIQDTKSPYTSGTSGKVYKWKPQDQLTIDFKFIPATKDEAINLVLPHHFDEEGELIDGYIYKIYNKDGRGIKMFFGNQNKYYDGFVILDEPDISLDNRIVECVWNENDSRFYPVRTRVDRLDPNGITTALGNWEDIITPITIDTITGNNLIVMRKYHNIQKFNLLKEFFRKDDIIVDIGSGRGGDLRKWNKLKLKKVYCVEPNAKNLEILEERAQELYLSYEIVKLNYGIDEYKSLKNDVDFSEVNGLVSFFSLTFLFKNESMYNNLLKSLKLFPPGITFIGMVMDGLSVSDLLDDVRVGNDYATFSNTAFQIEQKSKFDKRFSDEIEITIFDETSMVKEQREYLFYFSKFIKDVEKLGYEIQTNEFLDRGQVFDILNENSKEFSMLNRVFSFLKTK